MNAEEFFKENVIWNGTVISNPVQLMEAYHQSRVNAISDEDIRLANDTNKGAKWFKQQLLKQ